MHLICPAGEAPPIHKQQHNPRHRLLRWCQINIPKSQLWERLFSPCWLEYEVEGTTNYITESRENGE